MNSAKPKFRLLDVVVTSPPEIGWRFSGRGFIGQIRQYGDGRFVYVVAPLDDDEVGAVFDEVELEATGERHDASAATQCGPFHDQDIVRVSATCAHAEVAGRTGVIKGGDERQLAVWIDDLEEVWALPAADLVGTGARAPRTTREDRASLRVSQAGEVLGRDEYVVLEDTDDL